MLLTGFNQIENNKKGTFQEWAFPNDFQKIQEFLKESHIALNKDYAKVTTHNFFVQHMTETIVIIAFLTLILLMTIKIYLANITLSKEITARKQAEKVIKNQGYIEGIDCYLKKNGEKLYIDYKSFVVEPVNGKPYISGIARDISEKVLSEKKLKKLQEQIQQTQKIESIGSLAGGIAKYAWR